MLAILGGGWRGTAWMKKALGREGLLPVESLPYNADMIALIAQAKAAGRKAPACYRFRSIDGRCGCRAFEVV